jgi:excisionase family DNA binding protein
MSDLLDIRQAAARLHLSAWTLRTWIRKGRIEHVRLGRAIRFRPSAIDALIRESVKPRTGTAGR